MDSYLELAERVLRGARRPMTPRQILKHAYSVDIVPYELHGKTQHKTLGARLSVDIVKGRERSRFFRTKPGHFFLREFISDAELPQKYRTPILARRRIRELTRAPVLSINGLKLPEALSGVGHVEREEVFSAIRRNSYRYLPRADMADEDETVVWSFVVVTRNNMALSYRLGRYREDRDTFMMKRSIGFYAPVSLDNSGLFSLDDLGIVDCGISCVAMDLDLPLSVNFVDSYNSASQITDFFVDSRFGRRILLSVVRFECPNWFEPLGRRLAINDLGWLDLNKKLNHREDFDPWSQQVLAAWQSSI